MDGMGEGRGVKAWRLSDTKAKSETILPPHESLGMKLKQSLLNLEVYGYEY